MSFEKKFVSSGDLDSEIRYEIKIPFPAEKSSEVMAWVRLHPEQWRTAYPPRQVNNIYFDTYNTTSLNDNLDGVRDRTKLRIRWYGDHIGLVENAQFELKHKKGFIGWKSIIPIPEAIYLPESSWHHIISQLRISIKQASVLLQEFPVPTIINSYYRQYFASPDGKLRLTVDTLLKSYSQLASGLPNTERPSSPQPFTIVEIKTHPNNVERLADVLSYTTTRVSRFSKYVNAVMASPS